MRNSSSLPPLPPATAASASKKRHHTCQNSNQGLQKTSVSKGLPPKDRRTRDLPNLSDCHGCGLRINYSNPKERLQPLESVWRIVLLCKNCIKMVNSGQLCPYCFKDTVNLVSECVRCSDCERFIHQSCIVKCSDSPPWSYSCKESGLGFSVCIDCWVPKLLKNSVKVCRKKEITEKSGEQLSASQCDSRVLRKGKDRVISLEEVVNDANSVAKKKIAVAVKAKDKALWKAVVAKNAVLLASNALNLVAKKECGSKKREGFVTSLNNSNSVNEVNRFVDDADLAFQLHRAMNSSPRISKNTCSTNLSCSDPLKLKDSNNASPNDLGSGGDGKVAVCSNMLTNGNRDSNIMEASACVRTTGSQSAISSYKLEPELKTYQRNNKKWRECRENVENGYIGTSSDVAEKCTSGDDSRIVSEPQSRQLDEVKQLCHVNDARTSVVAGKYTAGDDCRIVSAPQSCQLDEVKQVFRVNSARNFCPESCNANIVAEKRSVNRRVVRYAIKYSRRTTGLKPGLCEEVNFRHEEANLGSVSFQKETEASAPGLPMDCSTECRALSGSSLRSPVVNLQACASIGVSSQEEG